MRQRQHRLRSRSAGLAITSCALVIGGFGAASAQDRFKWVEFFPDDKPHLSREITEKLSVGFESKLSAQGSENLNLDLADDEDEDEIQSEFNLSGMYESGGAFDAYFKFGIVSEALGGFGDNTRDFALEITEAYATLSSADRNQVLSFGRFGMSDAREWLFDEELDGAHFFLRGQKYAVELMYGREQIFKKDLLGERDDNEPDHLYGRTYANLPGDAVASAYGLYQFGHESDDADLYWLGASLGGETKNDIAYWAELAHVGGSEDGRDVSGFGLDVGLTKTFKKARYNPRLTLGFAFGSGDDGAGSDSAFRQTGIQDNEARYGGKTRIKSYGAVMNPELNNLMVLTLGTGIDVFKNSSLDLMYHFSAQHRASDDLRDSALDQSPTGRDRSLGQEINAVLAIREFDNIEIDIFGGVFFPGSAFAEGSEAAQIIGVDFSLEF